MPVPTPDPHELEQRAAERIMGDPSLRDELTDEEARPLLDWGLAQAAALVQRAVAQGTTETLDAAVDDLRRLMKRINRLVGHRTAGETERLPKDLERLARVSEQLYGSAVPRAAMARPEAFLAEVVGLDNAQLVQRLLQDFTPPSPPLAGEPSAPQPGPQAPPST